MRHFEFARVLTGGCKMNPIHQVEYAAALGIPTKMTAAPFMRDNCLSNRVFGSYDEIIDHCDDAWNKLVEQPRMIMSLRPRAWACGF